jgi:hypothetical protein
MMIGLVWVPVGMGWLVVASSDAEDVGDGDAGGSGIRRASADAREIGGGDVEIRS